MSVINSVNTNLRGTSGSGNFVGSNSPIFSTVTLGVATGTSLTFSGSGGIIGTSTNNNAAAGSVGQFISSSVNFASSVSVPNSTITAITSISLTAGDWDVFGNVYVTPVATTTLIQSWITTSMSFVDDSVTLLFRKPAIALNPTGLIVPGIRVSINGTTTTYLLVFISSSSLTGTACGNIYARRIR